MPQLLTNIRRAHTSHPTEGLGSIPCIIVVVGDMQPIDGQPRPCITGYWFSRFDEPCFVIPLNSPAHLGMELRPKLVDGALQTDLLIDHEVILSLLPADPSRGVIITHFGADTQFDLRQTMAYLQTEWVDVIGRLPQRA